MNRTTIVSRESAERAADVLQRLADRLPLDDELREEATVASRVLRLQLREDGSVSTVEHGLTIELAVVQSLSASALFQLESGDRDGALQALRSIARRDHRGS